MVNKDKKYSPLCYPLCFGFLVSQYIMASKCFDEKEGMRKSTEIIKT